MGPWRVKFVNPAMESRNPLEVLSTEGWIPWRLYDDDQASLRIQVFCPVCGRGMGYILPRSPAGHTWNGDRDRPTIRPSVGSGHKLCAGHYWVRDGQIIDAGTPAH